MIFFVLYTSIFTLAGVSLHISYSMKGITQFDRIIRFFLLFLMVHVVHAAFFRDILPAYKYVDRAAPFGLMYGPLLLFASMASKGRGLRRKTIAIHISPFLFAVPWYACFLLFSSFRESTGIIYYSLLYGSMALSWLGYSVWIIYKGSKEKDEISTEPKKLTSYAVIVLFALAVFLTLLVFNLTFNGAPARAKTSGLLIFIAMLGAVVFVYLHLLRRLFTLTVNEVQMKEKTLNTTPSYQKSAVSKELMEGYVEKVKEYIDAEYYLDADHSLDTMASALKIPRHHLSQLFSQHYKQSFLKYINSLRIKHACRILEDPHFKSNIEELAEACGFKSKASFYRNFSGEMNCTPSEYRERFVDRND